MTIEIIDSGFPLGHEIRGADLARGLSDAEFRQVEAAYDRYGVVVLRDQKLTPDQLLAYSRRFGPLDNFVTSQFTLKASPEIFVVSNVIEDGKPIGMADAGRHWHTDMWMLPEPPRGSILYALEVPHDAQGAPLGDTCFASTAYAYDTLPDAMKRRVDGRIAVFSRAKYAEYRTSISKDKSQQERFLKARGSVDDRGIEHPLVRVHPRTGRKCIYLAEGSVSHIVGMSEAESADLLAELLAHITRTDAVYRHKWRVGDAVMWDNCSALHKAVGDFELPQRRLMHRTTLSGGAQSAAAAE